MTAHRNDSFRAELLCGKHGAKTDRAVANGYNSFARPGLGGIGAKPTGAEHVGRRKQTRDQIVGRQFRGWNQGAIGERHPQQRRLRSPSADIFIMDAAALIARMTDGTRVVRCEEGADGGLPASEIPCSGALPTSSIDASMTS